jgi:hypothetical protein
LTSKVRLQPHVFLAFGLEKRKPPPTTWLGVGLGLGLGLSRG